jgi:pimeloyl-ACP methyl ester carboxylesterase
MSPVRRVYADGPFGQIHYRIAMPAAPTDRPPVLCLHQSPKSGRDFEALMAVLGEERCCIAPDTPGYGDSDAPPAPPTIADYGTAMLALLDGLQGEGIVPPGPVDLMGYHTGGAIAGWMARQWPERVRRLVFISLAAMAPDVRRERLAAMHIFPVPCADASNIGALWTLTETLNDERLDPEWRQRALGECLRSGARLPWGFRAVYDHDVMADLTMIGQPALVLRPRDDLWAETQAGFTLLRDARLVDVDAGNGFLDLDTDRVAQLVREFLA